MTPAELLAPVLGEMRALVGAMSSDDWSRPAGELEWTGRITIEHIASDLLHYAGQVA